MGLDNGVRLFRYKGKDPPKNKLKILNNYINNYAGIEKEKDGDTKNFEKIYIGGLKQFLYGHEGNELCYWRKCWNIRYCFISNIQENVDDYYYLITIDNLPNIIKDLECLLNKNKWQKNGGSIWSYKEYADALFFDILNLKKLYKYMSENPDVYAYFYDSY